MPGTKIVSRLCFPRRGLLLVLLAASAVLAAREIHAAGGVKRARPPKFNKSISDVFFPDAREKLVGPRPQSAEPGTTNVAATPNNPQPPDVPTKDAGWSKWIAAEVVEDEIKSQQIQLAETVQNPTKFKGGDYQKARENLSMLAVLFGIAAQYDARIRWQREAPAVRDVLARAGFNCKVGTDGSYKEAQARAEDVQSLVRGGSVSLPKAAAEMSWPKVADRGPLMKRLEQAQQQAIAPYTAGTNEFERHADKLAHEAQLMAALAEVITREGYEFADDETYLQYARSMQTQAAAVRDAAQQKNYQQARQAAGELSKACSNCHEGYRS
jgi:cytochrome c556